MRRFLVMLLGGLAGATAAGPAAQAQDGEQLFSLVCAMCHSVAPPPRAAPPMSHAAAYYLRAHPSPEAAAAAIVAFLQQPSAERSLLPPHAIERFGLMPAQSHLSPEQLARVARYVLTLADTAHAGGHGAGPP